MEIVTIDNGTFHKYLGTCGLKDLIVYPSTDSPARIYNEHLRQTRYKYICFMHADVTTVGFRDAVARTIRAYPDFGALGAVGTLNRCWWGTRGQIHEVMTVDSCCIIVNTEHGLFFDEKTFNEYHLYVEDYCMQVRELGKKVYTLDLDGFEYKPGLDLKGDYFVHHSHTLNKKGCSWGSYPKYRKLLTQKWKDVQTT